MPQNTHVELATAEAERLPEVSRKTTDIEAVRESALEHARSLAWLPTTAASQYFTERCENLAKALDDLLVAFKEPWDETASDDYRWLHDNAHLLRGELSSALDSLRVLESLPYVRTREETIAPRVAAIADGLLVALEN